MDSLQWKVSRNQRRTHQKKNVFCRTNNVLHAVKNALALFAGCFGSVLSPYQADSSDTVCHSIVLLVLPVSVIM